MTQAFGRDGWATLGLLALMVALNQMSGLFAGTRLARFAERIDLSFRKAEVQRDDLDAALAGYYEVSCARRLTCRYTPTFCNTTTSRTLYTLRTREEGHQ